MLRKSPVEILHGSKGVLVLRQAFAEVSFEQYRKLTRRELFLDEMKRDVIGRIVSTQTLDDPKSLT